VNLASSDGVGLGREILHVYGSTTIVYDAMFETAYSFVTWRCKGLRLHMSS
jgi:hypothetical protein